MKVTCHSCGAKYAIADDKVRGRRVKVRCKSCSTPIVVDGYAVETAPADAGGFAGSDDWSVNLSDTDQRTMSTDEIIAGWHSGLVREDAFVWKDGMDDWKPVLEVPELAGRFFERRPSSPAPSPAYAAPAPPPWQAPADNGAPAPGLGFGSAPVAAARPAAVRSGSRAGAADLFGNVAQAGNEEEATQAFPSSIPGSQPYEDQKPTGARNENSVLFSLDALKAGFTPAAQATPGPSRAAADTGGTANLDDLMNIGGGSGGSPLFGFSQNQALLHAPPPPEPPPPPPPEMLAPASLVPSYAPAAPPQKSSSKLFIAIGAAVALLLVVGVGLAVVMGGSGEKDEVAKNDSDEGATKNTGSSKKSDDGDKAAETKKGDETPGETEAKKDDGEAKKDEEKVPVTEEDKKRFAEAQAKKKEEEEKKSTDEKKTDEVAKKEEPSSGVGSFNKGAAVAALSSAAAAASGCKRPGGPTGTGRAIVTFAPSGNATSANVTGGSFGGTSVGGCIASVFRRAKVPPFDGNSVTVSKSFTIAP